MTPSLTIKAYAKLNLGLLITGLLENGYHTLDMVMQSVSLHDTITLTRREETGLLLSCEDPDVPLDERNLCVKAVQLLSQHVGMPLPVNIILEKRIPSQAGLAGGSADGAAVLAGLNELFSLGLSEEELLPLAARLGADVPFCLIGGTKRGRGFGELLSSCPSLPNCPILLVKPRSGVSTQESFARYDALKEKPVLSLEPLLEALSWKDLPRAAASLCNALEPCANEPEIPRLTARMMELGALGSRMTGSGSAVFGIFDREDTARHCQQKLAEEVPFAHLCYPVKTGWEIVGRESR